MDDVARLVEDLKALPLIDGADLNQPFTAYDSFELVLSAILRAALVQAPPDKRQGKNGELFRHFVENHFPNGRGRSDRDYAKRLWELRGDFVKEKRTGAFRLIHGHPACHFARADDGRPILNLESLIADFRSAVDEMAATLGARADWCELAREEIARRTVDVTADASSTQTFVVHTNAAEASSGTSYRGRRS